MRFEEFQAALEGTPVEFCRNMSSTRSSQQFSPQKLDIPTQHSKQHSDGMQMLILIIPFLSFLPQASQGLLLRQYLL